jgi:hypothetical protein
MVPIRGHDSYGGHNLQESAGFAPYTGFETAKLRESQGNTGQKQDPKVTSEDHRYQPDWNRAPRREPNVNCCQQNFIGNRIQIEADPGFASEPARYRAIEQIGGGCGAEEPSAGQESPVRQFKKDERSHDDPHHCD